MSAFDAIFNQMGEDQARKLIQKMDDEQLEQALQTGVDEFVVPELEEIKQRAQNSEDREFVRETYENLSDEEQQSAFNEALWGMADTFGKIRLEPKAGLEELKQKLRDPWTMEALLLIFNNPEHIDPSYADEMKETCTLFSRLALMNLAPECYTESEARDLMTRMDLSDDELAEVMERMEQA